MQKKLLILFLLVQFIFISNSYANSARQYIEDGYLLVYQQRFDEALDIFRAGLKKYPDDLSLIFGFSECQQYLGDYEIAINNYLKILKSGEKRLRAQLHHNLFYSYNELGQKHYFSEELCLRIIYHIEIYFELEPEFANDELYLELLAQTLKHYETARMGIRMSEAGGDGIDFNLTNDAIPNSEKQRYKQKSQSRFTS